MAQIDRLPPQNREAEEAVLGSILIDPDAYFDVAAILTPEMFYVQQNAWVYAAIQSLNTAQIGADVLTISEELRKMGKGGAVDEVYLVELVSLVPTSIHAIHYASIVRDCYTRRCLIRTAGKLANGAYDEEQTVEEVLGDHAQSISELTSTNNNEVQTFRSSLDSLLSIAERAYQGGEEPGVSSFNPDITRYIGRYQAGRLYILGARPGMGKTALLLQEYYNALRQGKRAVFFSLEMSAEDLMARIVSQIMRIPAESILNGRLSEEQWEALYRISNNIRSYKGHIADRTKKHSEIIAEINKLVIRGECDIVFIDYLQLVTPSVKSPNRNAEIEVISRELKTSTTNLKIPIITAAQLSRAVESRQDKRPMLSDLRDSGSIEQDADVVIFLYRDEYYYPDTTDRPGITELIIAKQRRGELRTIEMCWKGEFTLFQPRERGG